MLSSEEKLERVRSFYDDRIKGWMLADLRKGVKANANFLVALGCFVYTEVAGHLLPPLKEEIGKPEERHFYRCLFRFQSNDILRKLDAGIRQTGGSKGIYGMRHGMVHRYYPSPRKRMGDQYLFLSSIIAIDGVITDLQSSENRESPPIFIDDNRRVAIALNSYINELEKTIDDSYQNTFVKNNEDFIHAAISSHDQVLGAPTI